jgi:hypothetical protein
MTFALMVLDALFLALSGCGRKTDVRPPELIRPEAIDDLAAQGQQEGILLRWGRPERYADGSRMTDLAGFRVERSVSAGPFEAVAVLEVSDRDRFRQIREFRYLDSSVAAGIRHQYRVVSFTLDGDTSAPSNIVEAEWVPVLFQR